jgi:hypothetical protein
VSFGIFFPFWYVWTKKSLATLVVITHVNTMTVVVVEGKSFNLIFYLVFSARPGVNVMIAIFSAKISAPFLKTNAMFPFRPK